MEPLDIQGVWWLPEHDDHRVAGNLRWRLESGGELQLQGELVPPVWKDNVLADGSIQRYREGGSQVGHRYPVIHGQAEQQSYTLPRAFSQRVRRYGSDDPAEQVRADELLQGAFFHTPEAVQADRVFVELRHLTGWVDPQGLSMDDDFKNPSNQTFVVIAATCLPRLTTMHGEGSVDLIQSLGTTGDRIHSLAVTQGVRLRLAYPDPRPVSSFLDTASHFQDLLSIAVGKTADFERIVIHHPNLPLLSLAGTPMGNRRADVEYHARWSARSDPCPPVQRHEMYFTLADLGGIEGVGRWLGVAEEYRTELGRVMATRYSPAMFIEDRIMNVCAALDSFDIERRHTDPRLDFVIHITECVEFPGPPFRDLIVDDPKSWASYVKETRHDLAHHREAFRRKGSVGEHLLAEQLFWLFAMCMLRLAQAPHAVFESIAKHGQIGWLTEQAKNAQP